MPAAKGRYTPAAGGRGRASQQQGGKQRPQVAAAPQGQRGRVGSHAGFGGLVVQACGGVSFLQGVVIMAELYKCN